MPTFTMLSGVPASGKSRFARFLVEATPAAVLISSDARIEEIAARDGLSYQDSYRANAEDVSRSIRAEAQAAMAADRDVIWDQTNLTPERRAEILTLVPARYRRIAVAFEAPNSILNERIAQREVQAPRGIPDEVLAIQRAQYIRPDLSEGFDELRLVQVPDFSHAVIS